MVIARPTIEAVTGENLAEFAAFLHGHLDPSRSAAEWQRGLSPDWPAQQPNHGFVLRDGGAIVGGIGAYYADRTIEGRLEKFCNITSWCVLEAHRQQSMRLAMAVVAQPGYHFTDFSPTKVVAGTLKFLKFRPLDERQVVVLNLPWPGLDGMRTVSDPDAIAACLADEALKVYVDHRAFPWLRHVLVGRPGAWCHVIYKRRTFKGLPAATVIHASDREMLDAGWRRLSGHFLAQGLLSTHIDYRALRRCPWPSALRSGFNAKLFLSDRLRDEQIDYLYSETVALDL
jgi:hypothetical protein